jgi:hypothetical protein
MLWGSKQFTLRSASRYVLYTLTSSALSEANHTLGQQTNNLTDGLAGKHTIPSAVSPVQGKPYSGQLTKELTLS